MTQKWSNLNLPGALHFVTGNVLHRIPVFAQDECCNAFLGVCARLLRDWPTKLISYVIMPDHFHLIANPRDGDIQGLTGAVKSLSAKKIVDLTGDRRFLLPKPDKHGSIHQVWQDSFKALPLWSSWMIWQTSFREFYFHSGEPLRVDRDWWWPDDAEKLSKAMKKLNSERRGQAAFLTERFLNII